MSLSALGWLGLYFVSACLSFVNPVFGMMGYFVEYYRRPELQWWRREVPDWRWNMIIAVIWGISFALRRGSLRQLRPIKNLALPWLLSLNVLMVLVTAALAVAPLLSQHWTIQWTKLALIVPLLMIGSVRTRGQFNLYVAANMLGALWWGYDAWVDPDREAGRLMNIGSGDSLHDNAASVHLLTILPLAAVYVAVEKDRWLRGLALVALPFIINTLILCNSRGAMVGILASGAVGVMLIRRGYRVRFAAAGLAGLLAFFMLADDDFIRRQQTTADYETDGSAQGRLATWQGGYNLVVDRPLGTGGRGFHVLSPQYIPDVVANYEGRRGGVVEGRAPHNTYVMVASEWGVLGLVLWFGFHASTFAMLRRIKAKAQTEDFYYWRAFGLQVTLVSVLVAELFSDRLYAEGPYWVSAMVYALYRIQHTDYAEGADGLSVPTVTATAPPSAPDLAGASPAA